MREHGVGIYVALLGFAIQRGHSLVRLDTVRLEADAPQGGSLRIGVSFGQGQAGDVDGVLALGLRGESRRLFGYGDLNLAALGLIIFQEQDMGMVVFVHHDPFCAVAALDPDLIF